jgi:hypothetical protein
MKFLKRLWSLLFGKKEKAATIPADYTTDIVFVNEIELAELEEIEEPIVEIPEVVAEKIAEEAVTAKKKKPAKKKKYNGNIT